MKRKKLFLNLILAALGTVSFLGACEKKDDTSESIVEPAVYEDGEYTLLDFENQSDLYKTRIYTEQILDIYGKVEIYSDSETAEEKHVISGNSSLKYSVTDKVAEEAHYKPGLLFFFGESAYPDLPVERFASTSLMLSSSAEKEHTGYNVCCFNQKIVVFGRIHCQKRQEQRIKIGYRFYHDNVQSGRYIRCLYRIPRVYGI